MRQIHPLLLVSALIVGIAPQVRAFSLKDVPQDHWARKAVEDLVRHGLISGDPDGRFRGRDGLTRAEFAAAMMRLIEYLERRVKARAGKASDQP